MLSGTGQIGAAQGLRQPSHIFEPPTYLPSTMEMCSSRIGWRSLAVRRFVDPSVVDAFDIPPIGSQLVLLVKKAADNAGKPNVEFADGSRWRSAHYREGDIGLTPPGRGVSLRWANRSPHITVQVLIPEQIMREAAEDLNLSFDPARFDHRLFHDPLLRHAVTSIESAAEHGASETYAEAASIFIASHLLSGLPKTARETGCDRDLAMVEGFLAENLSSEVSLTDISSAVGINRFRLARLCKDYWGLTPVQRMTQMRMELGRKLLQETSLSIIEVAMECGYGNPSHFATAFKRSTGMSPREYRSR